jgi:hypothetical protein
MEDKISIKDLHLQLKNINGPSFRRHIGLSKSSDWVAWIIPEIEDSNKVENEYSNKVENEYSNNPQTNEGGSNNPWKESRYSNNPWKAA